MKITIKEITIESNNEIDGVVIQFTRNGNQAIAPSVSSPSVIPVSSVPVFPTSTANIPIPSNITTSGPSVSTSVPISVPDSGSFGDVY